MTVNNVTSDSQLTWLPSANLVLIHSSVVAIVYGKLWYSKCALPEARSEKHNLLMKSIKAKIFKGYEKNACLISISIAYFLLLDTYLAPLFIYLVFIYPSSSFLIRSLAAALSIHAFFTIDLSLYNIYYIFR